MKAYQEFIVFVFRFSKGDVKALTPFFNRHEAETYVRRVNRWQGRSFFCWLRGYQDPPKIKGVSASEMNELTHKAMSEYRKNKMRYLPRWQRQHFFYWQPRNENPNSECYRVEEEYLGESKISANEIYKQF